MDLLERSLSLGDDLAYAQIQTASAAWSQYLEVPIHFVEFLLLLEDKRFPTHRGIDGLAVIRALRQNFKRLKWSEGASTITQQLYNIHLRSIGEKPQRSLTFKRRQVTFALKAHGVYSKRDQLKLYLEAVYWGRSYSGIQQAALGYFGKAPIELSVEESFFLAERLACPNRRSGARMLGIFSRRCVMARIRQYGSDELRIAAIYKSFGLD